VIIVSPLIKEIEPRLNEMLITHIKEQEDHN